MAEKRNTAVVSGCKAIFKVTKDGVTRELLHSSDASYSLDIQLEEVVTFGSIIPRELVEVGTSVSFDCTTFRIYNKSAVAMGLRPKLSEIIKQPGLVVEMRELLTNNVMLKISGIKMSRLDGSSASKGLTTERYSFKGLTIADETDTDPESELPSTDGIKWGEAANEQ